MTILSIETSTSVCSAALSVDGQTIASRINRENTNHARFLSIFVKELLDELKQRTLTLDAVALSEGPGSYTGLRIGASTAKGLCYGYDIPLIPIATTEVLCASLMAKNEVQDGEWLLPMIDARRMEVYTALYRVQNGVPVLQGDIAAKVIESAESLEYGQGRNLFFGDGAAKCKELLAEKADFIGDIVPDAADMGPLAERYWQEKKV
ncbi:MAG: tRNA (adenosine(37)-N6)-threonylcarbamoyltransferase complex dimerization subunit type 1 TsaB, partial [Paludibacteraceae bacterium]|nr:tRNA (adenosine(37)-N6)-threonylcarbamoyltransferase complex dimerization subunit type 1 TsaB [Paludibacteraceae bacterium]